MTQTSIDLITSLPLIAPKLQLQIATKPPALIAPHQLIRGILVGAPDAIGGIVIGAREGDAPFAQGQIVAQPGPEVATYQVGQANAFIAPMGVTVSYGTSWVTAGQSIEHAHSTDMLSGSIVDEMKVATEFLTAVQRLYVAGDEVTAIDLIYDEIDELLLNRKYDLVSLILNGAAGAVSTLSMSALLSLLTITLPWATLVEGARKVLVQKTREVATEQEGSSAAERLLQGLDV